MVNLKGGVRYFSKAKRIIVLFSLNILKSQCLNAMCPQGGSGHHGLVGLFSAADSQTDLG